MPVGVRIHQLPYLFISMVDDCRKRVYQWPIYLFISMVDDCRELVYQCPIYLCMSMVADYR
jgi:hypothetical protein